MKIGIDARAAIWYRGTGIGTYTYQIIKNLSRIDKTNNYRLFWPGNASKDFLEASENFDFDVVGETKDKFWEEIHIPARLAGDRVDVYHVPQNGIGLPGKKTCPQVVTVHDLIPYIYPETVGRGYQRIFLQEMPRIVEQADRIITVSEHSRRDLKRYFNLPDWKIDVIYEAADDIYRPL
ncbi:MAG: glycosyltransferase, partial [Actinobacteria bacterium]|nr:glycosyltransferase [Actinomycetota bacterium]